MSVPEIEAIKNAIIEIIVTIFGLGFMVVVGLAMMGFFDKD